MHADCQQVVCLNTLFATSWQQGSSTIVGHAHHGPNCLHTVRHACLHLGQPCNLMASISWNLNEYAAGRLAVNTRPHTGFHSELCVSNVRETFIERTTLYAQRTAIATELSLQLRLSEWVSCGEYRGVCGGGPWQGCPHRSPGQRKLPSCLPRPPHGTAHWLSVSQCVSALSMLFSIPNCLIWFTDVTPTLEI